jgi:hypothetical protein
LINIPLGSAATNKLIEIVLNTGKFDIIPTDILLDESVFGKMKETPNRFSKVGYETYVLF